MLARSIISRTDLPSTIERDAFEFLAGNIRVMLERYFAGVQVLPPSLVENFGRRLPSLSRSIHPWLRCARIPTSSAAAGSGDCRPRLAVGGAEDCAVLRRAASKFWWWARNPRRTRPRIASDVNFQVAPPSSERPTSPPSETSQRTFESGVRTVSPARFEANCICCVRARSADSRACAWRKREPTAACGAAAAAAVAGAAGLCSP